MCVWVWRGSIAKLKSKRRERRAGMADDQAAAVTIYKYREFCRFSLRSLPLSLSSLLTNT